MVALWHARLAQRSLIEPDPVWRESSRPKPGGVRFGGVCVQ